MKWILIVMFINTNLAQPGPVSNIHSTYFNSQPTCLTALKWVQEEYGKSGGRATLKAECFPEQK